MRNIKVASKAQGPIEPANQLKMASNQRANKKRGDGLTILLILLILVNAGVALIYILAIFSTPHSLSHPILGTLPIRRIFGCKCSRRDRPV